ETVFLNQRKELGGIRSGPGYIPLELRPDHAEVQRVAEAVRMSHRSREFHGFFALLLRLFWKAQQPQCQRQRDGGRDSWIVSVEIGERPVACRIVERARGLELASRRREFAAQQKRHAEKLMTDDQRRMLFAGRRVEQLVARCERLAVLRADQVKPCETVYHHGPLLPVANLRTERLRAQVGLLDFIRRVPARRHQRGAEAELQRQLDVPPFGTVRKRLE